MIHFNGRSAFIFSKSAELFTDYFEENYSDHNPHHCSPHGPYAEEIQLPSISREEVNDALKKLDPHKAICPDGIPNGFMRLLANELTEPLFRIFTESSQSGTFPDKWKTSHVRPFSNRVIDLYAQTIAALRFSL